MSDMEFKEKFIGYVDILGWTKKVEAAEAGAGMPLSELIEVLKDLGTPADQKRFEKEGPTICPKSACVQRDLDFKLTQPQYSDGVIVSSEISPAGVIVGRI